MGGGPIRSCAGCRRRRPQHELVRIALTPGGEVAVDSWEAGAGRSSGGRSPGRGAYVCPDPACVTRAWKSRALQRALRYEGRMPEDVLSRLRAITTTATEGRDG